jgi:hypothetical protein
MKSRSVFRSLCLILFVFLTFAGRIVADDVPTFSDPDVTAFVKNYAQFVHDYEDAYKAIKAGDDAKLHALQDKSSELQSQARNVSAKVKPDEAQRFTDFLEKCAQRLVDVTKQ